MIYRLTNLLLIRMPPSIVTRGISLENGNPPEREELRRNVKIQAVP
jgi:hypothetical protein